MIIERVSLLLKLSIARLNNHRKTLNKWGVRTDSMAGLNLSRQIQEQRGRRSRSSVSCRTRQIQHGVNLALVWLGPNAAQHRAHVQISLPARRSPAKLPVFLLFSFIIIIIIFTKKFWYYILKNIIIYCDFWKCKSSFINDD